MSSSRVRIWRLHFEPDCRDFPNRRALDHRTLRHGTAIEDFEGQRCQAVICLFERGPICRPALSELPLVDERRWLWGWGQPWHRIIQGVSIVVMVETLKAALSACERDTGRLAPVLQILIFPPPAPICISVAVDLLEQWIRRQHDAAKEIFDLVPQPAPRMLQRPQPCFGAMPDNRGGRVRPTVIRPDGKIIDVVEASVVAVLATNHEADILERSAIERESVFLFDDEHAIGNDVIEFVARKIGAQKRDESFQMRLTVPIGNDDV